MPHKLVLADIAACLHAVCIYGMGNYNCRHTHVVMHRTMQCGSLHHSIANNRYVIAYRSFARVIHTQTHILVSCARRHWCLIYVFIRFVFIFSRFPDQASHICSTTIDMQIHAVHLRTHVIQQCVDDTLVCRSA